MDFTSKAGERRYKEAMRIKNAKLDKDQMIQICRNCLDFDAPMITTLSEEVDISRKEAEDFIAENIEVIYA